LGWKILEDFFGRGGKLKKKYHLVRWEKNCKAKKKIEAWDSKISGG
jgi:hypothetical protein